MDTIKQVTRAILILIIGLVMAACSTMSPGEMRDWPTRYRAEVEALTKAYTVATAALATGNMDKARATKVLEETDRLSNQLTLVTILRPAVPGTDDLVAAKERARAQLAAAVR